MALGQDGKGREEFIRYLIYNSLKIPVGSKEVSEPVTECSSPATTLSNLILPFLRWEN